ncbi:dihydrofolate reductase family protein [Panacagrimonas sp.]|uniref:dihydrofolate reductase family protein n=1 Tax=Panacagrimonas sp. TaxID=2480088 RepID=UPI003B52D882
MKVTLQLATSLDGYIARPDGGFDWCFTDQDYGMAGFFASVDAVVMGSRSWELTRKLRESLDPAKRYYVLSNRDLRLDADNLFAFSGDVADLRLRMVEDGVQHAWLFGGANVAGQFAQEGLIDECMIAVHPLALGAGIPLFRDLQRDLRFKLRDTRIFDTGLVMLHYQVLNPA